MKEEREKLKLQLKKCKEDLKLNETAIKNYYENFFTKQQNNDFVLYKDFPPFEALQIYMNSEDSFPLYKNGVFKVKELAEIIKQCYQYERQQEYKIITLGTIDADCYDCVSPHLYFLIGNTKTLHPFYEYDKQFINHSYDLRCNKTSVVNHLHCTIHF